MDTKTNICQHTALQPLPRTYGKSAQIPNPSDETPLLEKKWNKKNATSNGQFLYYGRAVDPLILHALINITSEKSAPTQKRCKKWRDFLDYMSWHPNVIIRFLNQI